MIFLIIKKYLLKYRFYIVIGVLLLSLVLYKNMRTEISTDNPVIVDALENDTDNNSNHKDEDVSLETYHVDIKGAIKNPGVYAVTKGSNVNDVIELAGGLKSNGTTSNINLSKRVDDEMVIYIYTKSELNKLKNNETQSISVTNNECKSDSKSADITNCVVEDSTLITNTGDTPVNETEQSNSKLVNINTATKEELLTLTGIGESKANCIIAYRQEKGSFNNIEDIKNVSGIGEALFEKIKESITV